jgi:hypothetical protein
MPSLKSNRSRTTSQRVMLLPIKDFKDLKKLKGNCLKVFYYNKSKVKDNPVVDAVRKLQKLLKGEFEKAGIYSDADILDVCMQIRKNIEGYDPTSK